VPASPECPGGASGRSVADQVGLEAAGRKILLDQLTRSPRTRQELAGQLDAKQIPPSVAIVLLDRFEEVGLIDDQAFALNWISSRRVRKGLSRRALAEELRHKGVDAAVVGEALGELEPDDDTETARALVRRKLPSMSNLDVTVRTRRLVAMLARKGYEAELSFAVVAEAIADHGDDPPDWA
jgi:regulatory protein